MFLMLLHYKNTILAQAAAYKNEKRKYLRRESHFIYFIYLYILASLIKWFYILENKLTYFLLER